MSDSSSDKEAMVVSLCIAANAYEKEEEAASKRLWPLWVIELPCEAAARQIASRSVCLRCCIELWATTRTEEELHNTLRALPLEHTNPYFQPGVSFKIKVDTFCNKITQADKVAKIETFGYLPVEGPVNLKNPDLCLQFLEYYGLDSNKIPEKPYSLYFGRLVRMNLILDGQRDLIAKLSLKTRKFIGNTSMDPQLSLLMANQARVTSGDIILDPFVGSGSLLVAAAQFGGYVLGTDIDYLMLHGRTRPTRIQKKKHREKDESIRTNMEQYGRSSQYIDAVVADAALPMWRADFKLDAIITDPPYGIREAAERIGSAKSYIISEHHLPGHIPSKVEYGLPNIYMDLLSFAARHLRVGGRLVSWVPIVREDYDEEKLPSHPCLKLVANSEQILSTYTSRRLITLEKLQEPEEQQCTITTETSTEQFRAKFFKFGEELRRQRKERRALELEAYRASVREKNTFTSPHYETTSAINCCETTQEEPTDTVNSSQIRESNSSER
uniref:tRNA (guanine(10)-N(2))-methyltransferase TRMT11 n=1 Tax=Timema genevievae TaxID=629358 RepID=A0A7R9PPN6_TIMGE|nr:unnamed protein product [Timema genevievae]